MKSKKELGLEACKMYRILKGKEKLANVTEFQLELARAYYDGKRS